MLGRLTRAAGAGFLTGFPFCTFCEPDTSKIDSKAEKIFDRSVRFFPDRTVLQACIDKEFSVPEMKPEERDRLTKALAVLFAEHGMTDEMLDASVNWVVSDMKKTQKREGEAPADFALEERIRETMRRCFSCQSLSGK